MGPAALLQCGEGGGDRSGGGGAGEGEGEDKHTSNKAGVTRTKQSTKQPTTERRSRKETLEDHMHRRVVQATRRSPDRGLGYMHRPHHRPAAAAAAARGQPSDCGIPQVPSTLWNTMVAPLLPLHVAGFLWYQGETNADKPVLYRQVEEGGRWRGEN